MQCVELLKQSVVKPTCTYVSRRPDSKIWSSSGQSSERSGWHARLVWYTNRTGKNWQTTGRYRCHSKCLGDRHVRTLKCDTKQDSGGPGIYEGACTPEIHADLAHEKLMVMWSDDFSHRFPTSVNLTSWGAETLKNMEPRDGTWAVVLAAS